MATATAREPIKETVFQEGKLRVDRDAGMIYGVKILGERSKNGRLYTPEAMRQAVAAGVYEGRKSYTNHPKRSQLYEDRNLRDWTGIFKNTRYEEGRGIFGDQKVRKSSPDFEALMEAAEDEEFAKAVGYSHVADCEGSYGSDGVETIESINEVFSVDFVTDPATTAGVFESRNSPMPAKTKKITIKKAVEGDARLSKVLMEMDGDMMPPETAVEVPAEASAEDQMQAAIDAMVLGVLHDSTLDKGAKLAKIRKVLGVEEDMTGGGEASDPEPETSGDEPATESDKRLAKIESELAETRAKNLLLESGRDATAIRVKALASANPADQKALLESWPKKEAPRRTTRGLRPESSPGVGSSSYDSDDDDYERYESRYAESLKRAQETIAKR